MSQSSWKEEGGVEEYKVVVGIKTDKKNLMMRQETTKLNL